MADIIQQAVDEGMATYNGVKTFSSEVRLRLALKTVAEYAIKWQQSIRVDVEGIGACEITVRDGVAYMPAVTVADIVSKSCLVPRAALVPVGYVDPVQLDELKREECAAIQLGTQSMRYRRTLPLFTEPAAGVDLEQFRPAVESRLRKRLRSLDKAQRQGRIHLIAGLARDISECRRLLAVIDAAAQAVRA